MRGVPDRLCAQGKKVLATTSLSREPLSVLPLGGLGKIGMNAMLVGTRGRYVLVDAGIGFAPVTMIGAEKTLPDLDFLSRYRDQIEAVVITHGHEDHIGALPWVLPQLDKATPVLASRFTTELIKNRLEEHGLWSADRMRELSPAARVAAGPFEVQALRVTHSIPDCASVVLRSEAGSVLHTADWKIDDEPMDGEQFDRAGFAALAGEIDLMLSDSTNVLSPGRTRSEREVVRTIGRRIESWPGRVVITLFASNLHRLRGLAELAQQLGRRLVLCGRSLWKYMEAADRSRQPSIPRELVLDIEQARDLAPERALVVMTGSQGESRSALFRAADNDYDLLKLGRDDMVLHSARIIPGNEGEVHTMWNRLAALGVTLVNERNIHTSGHAQQDELAELIGLVKPKSFVPVHGETTFLYAHAALANSLGVPSRILRDGQGLDLPARSDAKKGSPLDFAKHTQHDLTLHWNDGPVTGDEDELRLKERKRVAWNGLIVVDAHVKVSGLGYKVVGPVNVEARALYLGEDDAMLKELADTARRVIENAPDRTPQKELVEAIKASVRAAARRQTDKRPEVLCVLHSGRLA